MALVVKDRVKQFSATAGTGTLTLGGTPTGFQAFSVLGDGSTTYYAIVDNNNGDWEVGLGTYTASGTTLSRDTVLESSNSGSLVSFGSDTKEVFVTYPAEKAVYAQDSGIVETPSAGLRVGSYTALRESSSGFPPEASTLSNNWSADFKLVADGFGSTLTFFNGELRFSPTEFGTAGSTPTIASGFLATNAGLEIGNSFTEATSIKSIKFYTSVNSGSLTNLLESDGSGNFNLDSKTGSVVLKTNNTSRLSVSTTAFTATLPWRGQNGTASAPALSASADTNTGVYFPSADTVGISTGGTQRMLISSSGVQVAVIDAGNLVGQVAFFAMSTAPTGWLKANGAEVSRTTYAALFAAIGETWGVGDGSTTFNLPDLRDRMPIGADNLYTLGATGGSKDAIVVDHTHSITDPGHRHQLRGDADTVPDGGVSIGTDDGVATPLRVDTCDFSTTGITINSTGSSGTDANLPPYAAMVACIKY